MLTKLTAYPANTGPKEAIFHNDYNLRELIHSHSQNISEIVLSLFLLITPFTKELNPVNFFT